MVRLSRNTLGERVCILTVMVSLAMPAASTRAIAQEFDSRLPPEFGASAAQGLADTITSCSGNTLANAIQDFSSAVTTPGASTAGVSIETQCKMSSALSPEVQNALGVAVPKDCKAIEKFSTDDAKALAEAKLGVIACNESKIRAALAEMACLKSQASSLAAQVGSLQQVYTANTQRMEGDVKQMDDVIEDTDAKKKEVLTLLNGDEETGGGKGGLQQLQDELEQSIQPEISKQVLGMDSQVTNLATQRQALVEIEGMVEVSATAECVKRIPPSVSICQGANESNGLPRINKTALDQLVCRATENAQLDKAKVVKGDARAAQDSTEAQANLRSHLENLFAELPTGVDVPTDEAGGLKLQEANKKITSMAELDRRLDSDPHLGRLSRELNLPILASLKVHFRNCNAEGKRAVAKDRSRANGALNKATKKVDELEKTILKTKDDMVTKFASVFDRGVAMLTKLSTPLNKSACQNSSASAGLGCMRSLEAQLDALLNGNGTGRGTNIVLKGKGSQGVLTVGCSGLKNCVQVLKNSKETLDVKKGQIETFKKDYVFRANASMVGFAESIKKQLSPQSQILNDRLSKLNVALGELGMDSLDIQPMEGEELETDERTGLLKGPKNVAALIGANTNPPLPDIRGKAFDSSPASAQQRLAEEKKDVKADLKEFLEGIEDAKASCAEKLAKKEEEKKEKAQNKIDSALGAVTTDVNSLAHCAGMAGCKDQAYLRSLIHTIQSLSTTDDRIDAGDTGNLVTGIRGVCGRGAPKVGPKDQTEEVNEARCNQVFTDLKGKVDNVEMTARKTRGDSKAGSAQ